MRRARRRAILAGARLACALASRDDGRACSSPAACPATALERLGAEHEVDVWPERLPAAADELRARAARAEGLLSLLTDRWTPS